MSKVLLIDDDVELVGMFQEYLTQEGFDARAVHDGESGAAEALTGLYAIAVLDVMMPRMNGLETLRRIRAGSNLPILMLTARAEETDRVVGLEMGADDYLAKPFATRELLARIRAVLRRTRMLPPNLQPVHQARALRFGDWTLDTTARHLLDAQGTLVSLTGGEFRLLRVLLDHPQRVLHRDQLLNLTQGRDTEAFDRSIDLLISRLRQRLRDDPREPRYIKTVRNEGYVLCAEVVAA